MKKDVFNVWFREFASLVFTQTVQAFLLAAVMSVIVSTASSASAQDQNVGVSATGVIAIIALTSISKIEILVKKIFGVDSQFGDPSMKNGMGAFAGGLVAAKMAGRLLNNVPKMGGGVKGFFDGRRDLVKAEQRRARDLGALAKGTSGGIAQNNMNNALKDQNSVDPDEEEKRKSDNAAQLAAQARNSASALGKQNSNWDYDLEKLYRVEDNYEKAKSDAKKKQRDSIYKGLSGVSETAGALLAAPIGASIAAASGSSIAQGMATAAGVGDMVGQFAVGATKTAGDIRKDVGATKKAQEKAMNEMNKTSQKYFGTSKEKITSYGDMNKRYTEIVDEYKKRVDAGNID